MNVNPPLPPLPPFEPQPETIFETDNPYHWFNDFFGENLVSSEEVRGYSFIDDDETLGNYMQRQCSCHQASTSRTTLDEEEDEA